jgi:hypothetical protein
LEAYLETGETGATLSGMNINYLGIFDKSGIAVWTQGIDLQEGKELDLGALTGDRLAAGHPLLQHPQLASRSRGSSAHLMARY